MVRNWVLVLCACAIGAAGEAQQSPVTARKSWWRLVSRGRAREHLQLLRPMRPTLLCGSPLWTKTERRKLLGRRRRAGPQLIQRNKTFQPHVLVVEVGTLIQFPNKDPFFHNVFSLYDGKRFDLGLYEAGTRAQCALANSG